MHEFSVEKVGKDYHKCPPHSHQNAFSNKRLIHEAIYTVLAAKLNTQAGNPLRIPECHLIFNDGIPQKLVLSEVPYEHHDNVSCFNQLPHILKHLKFGSALTLGYLLADPDRLNNTGFDASNFQTIQSMVCIDFGLSDYLWLQEEGLLLEKGKGRLPSTSMCLFQITHQPLAKLFHNGIRDYVFTLMHEAPFNKVPTVLNQLDASVRAQFLSEVTEMIDAYISVTTQPDFKTEMTKALLGSNDTDAENQKTIQTLLARIQERGNKCLAKRDTLDLTVATFTNLLSRHELLSASRPMLFATAKKENCEPNLPYPTRQNSRENF